MLSLFMELKPHEIVVMILLIFSIVFTMYTFSKIPTIENSNNAVVLKTLSEVSKQMDEAEVKRNNLQKALVFCLNKIRELETNDSGGGGEPEKEGYDNNCADGVCKISPLEDTEELDEPEIDLE